MERGLGSESGDINSRMRPSLPPQAPQVQEHNEETTLGTNRQSCTISKKPLIKFMKKITQNKEKNSGGCAEWKCTLCYHVFKGSYTRVWHHFLSIPGLGVKGCTCSLEQRMVMTKLHMKANGINEIGRAHV